MKKTTRESFGWVKIDQEAKELAERVWNTMKRDHGRHWLWYMGVDPEEISKYTDDDLVALSEEVSSWPMKEPETCGECGQIK